MAWRSKSNKAVPDAGDDVVAKRLAELTHREAALRKITEAMEEQRTRVEEREREAERIVAKAGAADDQRIKEWRRRTEQFERRAEQADQRTEQAKRRAEQADQRAAQAKQRAEQADQGAEQAKRRAEQAERRVRELEQRLKARPEPPATPPPPVKQEPVALPAAPIEEPARAPAPALEVATTEGTYTLQRLERLVEEARLRGDPRVDEWSYYLPLLREHAEPDGRLPAQFASLVDSIFV